jgi:hypothetical protein
MTSKFNNLPSDRTFELFYAKFNFVFKISEYNSSSSLMDLQNPVLALASHSSLYGQYLFLLLVYNGRPILEFSYHPFFADGLYIPLFYLLLNIF